jgi:hypothetical protein
MTEVISEIADEFPGWTGWRSVATRQFHARLTGSIPLVMVHADRLEDLREQIVYYAARSRL